MTTQTIRIHDVTTDEIIDREMNAEEIEQRKIDAALAKAKNAELVAKAAIHNSALAKLAALGLTEDEVNGLIS